MKKLLAILLAVVMLGTFAAMAAAEGTDYALPPTTIYPPWLAEYGTRVNPGEHNFPFLIISQTGWTVSSDVDWIVPRTPSGSGILTVSVDIAENFGATRTGTITVVADCGEILDIVIVQDFPGSYWWATNRPAWWTFIVRWIFFGWLWMSY